MAAKNIKNQMSEGELIEIRDGLKRLTEVVTKFIGIPERVNEIDEVLTEVISRIYSLNQQMLNAKMDITGLSTNGSKDIRLCVLNYFKDLKVEISPHEVLDAYEFTKKFKVGDKKIIRVIFSHETVKRRAILKKIQRDKGKKPSVFFNDVLTRENEKLLIDGKKLKKKGLISDVKFMNGRLYAFPNDTRNKILVENANDLHAMIDENYISHKDPLIEDSGVGNSVNINSCDSSPQSTIGISSPHSSSPPAHNSTHQEFAQSKDSELQQELDIQPDNDKVSNRKPKKRKNKRKIKA